MELPVDKADDAHDLHDGAHAGARIVVVDDDPGIRDVVYEFLGRHGFEVETAADAAGLNKALAAGPVDLVVLDVMLPGEDGLAICRRLAAAANGPAVIMLSAMGEETDRIVGLELGADDYLPKPCNPRELLARVRAVLRRRGEVAAGRDRAGRALRVRRLAARPGAPRAAHARRRGGQPFRRRVLAAARPGRAAPAGADPRPAARPRPRPRQRRLRPGDRRADQPAAA